MLRPTQTLSSCEFMAMLRSRFVEGRGLGVDSRPDVSTEGGKVSSLVSVLCFQAG